MKVKLFITVFFFSLISYAQNFSGKATYKTIRKSNFKINSKNSDITEKQAEEIQKRIQKMNQKTYILQFDKNSSIYKLDAKINTPKPKMGNGNRVMVMSFGGSGNGDVYYKNIQDKRFVNKTEIMGKLFLVKDSLRNFDWKLTSETKNIGEYTCYKATFENEVTNTKVSMVNGELKEQTEQVKVVTNAWYTPQVPISNGPKDYYGLPGLILEINDGTNTIVCTEIVIDPSQTKEIKEPVKGKIVSQREYQEISRKKSKEMMERFKSRKGVNMGNGATIKIGG
ncbi:GLPGLI family protein [Polaribacter aquimarinus]|uniref:GLPGLI family protein n=1 Tax=Polaribacter aquimarinus TaxID=2100726 RepID=A0A2U2J6V2_9FLAO|nr:GLPGLI family protein [Polaribacter aquimarinus]PWG04068.1 GLPGLI family protein [Polaribacter aquimarinus]